MLFFNIDIQWFDCLIIALWKAKSLWYTSITKRPSRGGPCNRDNGHTLCNWNLQSPTEHKLRLCFKENEANDRIAVWLPDAPQFLTHLHKPLVFLAGGDVTERQKKDLYQLKFAVNSTFLCILSRNISHKTKCVEMCKMLRIVLYWYIL